METKTATQVVTDPDDGATHPYGVRVGDAVHFWRAGSPALSEDYIAPACWHALVLGFSYDARSVWLADLAVVDPEDGSLRVERGVQQMESYASTPRADRRRGERSYGVGSSWHRLVSHPAAP